MPVLSEESYSHQHREHRGFVTLSTTTYVFLISALVLVTSIYIYIRRKTINSRTTLQKYTASKMSASRYTDTNSDPTSDPNPEAEKPPPPPPPPFAHHLPSLKTAPPPTINPAPTVPGQFTTSPLTFSPISSPPFPQTSSSSSTSSFTHNPSLSLEEKTPQDPQQPRRRSYTRTLSTGQEVSGEIVVSGTEGWRRHTRVFGGGVCKACEESGGMGFMSGAAGPGGVFAPPPMGSVMFEEGSGLEGGSGMMMMDGVDGRGTQGMGKWEESA